MADANTVAVKVPAFWTNNPKAWFSQLEAQFGLRNVTVDDTKFWYVVSNLDRDAADRCTAFLEAVPDTDKYPAIKRHLIRCFDLSDEERADRLLDLNQLGDRRPSELADVILRLCGTRDLNFLLRRIFMRALPCRIRSAIATCHVKGLQELAAEADLAMTSTAADTPVTPLSNCTERSSNDLNIDAVNPSRKRNLCYYHQRFGARALRCRQPCDWQPTTPAKTTGNGQGGLRS